MSAASTCVVSPVSHTEGNSPVRVRTYLTTQTGEAKSCKLILSQPKKEFRKKYSYGNYQDKGLPENKEMNISPQSYVKKKNPTIIDINEYLRNIRKGVDR